MSLRQYGDEHALEEMILTDDDLFDLVKNPFHDRSDIAVVVILHVHTFLCCCKSTVDPDEIKRPAARSRRIFFGLDSKSTFAFSRSGESRNTGFAYSYFPPPPPGTGLRHYAGPLCSPQDERFHHPRNKYQIR